jgi:hypothetical protein
MGALNTRTIAERDSELTQLKELYTNKEIINLELKTRNGQLVADMIELSDKNKQVRSELE